MRTKSEKTLTGLVSNGCDMLRNFLLWLCEKGEFNKDEREKVIEAVVAIDRVSIILCGHTHEDKGE